MYFDYPLLNLDSGPQRHTKQIVLIRFDWKGYLALCKLDSSS